MNIVQTEFQQTNSRRWLVYSSPILVVILGHFAARLFLYLFNDWAWLGSSLVYWGSMLFII